ncbi:uncharacterized protein PG986_004705 [Apiospora aurea]|uniref:Uncharacterized protein n=1 Tax=Apiospora aurea TaxID=335848 RepID=A0ABR1QNB9_9PEZI
MSEFHICYGVGVGFQTRIAGSELPSVPPTSEAQVSQAISSRFQLDLKFSTNLLGGGQRTSYPMQQCFGLDSEEALGDDETLFGLINANFVLTEVLPPMNTIVQDSETTQITEKTRNWHPIILMDGLHHVHVESGYDVLLERQSTDFATDAKEFLHEMSEAVDNSEGEEFISEVRTLLLDLVVSATGGAKPECGNEWIGDLNDCLDRINETDYVEAFGGALEELQGRCLEHQRSRGGRRQGTELQRWGTLP